MDKFGSAKGAFAQARALAESGRSQVTKQFDKIDARYPIGGGQKPGAGNSAGTPTEEHSHPLPTTHAAPPPPPSRFGGPPPPPPGRGRSTSSVSGAGAGAAAAGGAAPQGVFTNMSTTEKEAFFALLDEYFSSRPHLAHLFQQQSSSSSSAPPPPAPVAPAASRPPPPPAKRGIGTAVALYDFEAGQAEDLPFREGDRIEVLEVVSDDWYRGALNGREGIFPSAYVQMQG